MCDLTRAALARRAPPPLRPCAFLCPSSLSTRVQAPAPAWDRAQMCVVCVWCVCVCVFVCGCVLVWVCVAGLSLPLRLSALEPLPPRCSFRGFCRPVSVSVS
eukprot:2259123-Rhodomonas_salina.1